MTPTTPVQGEPLIGSIQWLYIELTRYLRRAMNTVYPDACDQAVARATQFDYKFVIHSLSRIVAWVSPETTITADHERGWETLLSKAILEEEERVFLFVQRGETIELGFSIEFHVAAALNPEAMVRLKGRQLTTNIDIRARWRQVWE